MSACFVHTFNEARQNRSVMRSQLLDFNISSADSLATETLKMRDDTD
jgi:hypothetical protein